MEEFAVEIIHRETIKPSKPTPLSHQNMKLSLLDQLAPMICVPFIFCYPNDAKAPAANDHFAKAEGRSQRLKKSLSEMLTRFYPFAGRISSFSLVECNDEGVAYIETRVNCLLQDILKQPDLESLKKLVPIQMEPAEASKGDLFLVKVNFFQCGGMVIGVSMTHKIADMYTFNLFINCWAAIARGSCDLVLPDFETASSLFPPIDLPFPDSAMDFKVPKVATRRLVFDASKISMLKARAASLDVPQPTRVEAVAALIWKCAMAAATSNRGGFKRPSGLLQAANLRKGMNPPLSESSTGNLAIGFVARSSECEQELNGLDHLVTKLRSGMSGFKENLLSRLQGSNAVSEILQIKKEIGSYFCERDVDFYICSSWSGFDVYGADFGWGKPRWVSFGSAPPLNYYNLMDSRDHSEGIEAWLTLTEAEMSYFECNKELLAFASVNPSITVELTSSSCKSTASSRKLNSRM